MQPFMLLFALVLAAIGLPATASSDTDDASTLTVMTFNIRYGTANDGANSWPSRSHLVMDVFTEYDPAIVGLQEALGFQIAEILGAHPRYGSVGVGRDDGKTRGEYAAILYDRSRFSVDASGTFWLSDTPDVVASKTWGNGIPRICTWARLVDLRSGDAVYVYNAHYDHRSQPSRIGASRLIAEHLAGRPHPDPVILLGDLNAGEDNPAVTLFTDGDDGPSLTNAFRDVHPDAADVGTFNAFRGVHDGAMIDHVFVDPDLTVIDAGIDRSYGGGPSPSDHDAVWATVRMP